MENYEQKYKDALSRAREMCAMPTDKATMEYVFPELKESEDEESKKWILEYLHDGLRKSDEQFKDHFRTAIAWLEKQKSQWTDEDERLYKDVHWQDVRERAAIAALQGAASRSYYPEDCAKFAVNCADKLVELLKKK